MRGLSASSGPQAELADDVLDTMRALRAADVLRQRGSVLRTSGGFELCMDAETARAVCTMRTAAGFRLDASSDVLRNPADPRDWNSSPRQAGERRGTSDRFVLRFVKPAK